MHRKKVKNYSRTTSHRESMMKNMVKSFKKHGVLKTTLAKAKGVKPILEKAMPDAKIMMARIRDRKGDGAKLAQLYTEEYVEKKFGSTDKSKANKSKKGESKKK